MKKILLIGIILFSISNINAQCNSLKDAISDVKSYADDCFDYAKKAYYAQDMGNAQYFAKKAKNSSEITMGSAIDAEEYLLSCSCKDSLGIVYNIKQYAEEAFVFSEKAYLAKELETIHYYAKKAKRSSEKCKEEALLFSCDK